MQRGCDASGAESHSRSELFSSAFSLPFGVVAFASGTMRDFAGKRAARSLPKNPRGPAIGEGGSRRSPAGVRLCSSVCLLIASDMANSFEEKRERAQSFEVFEVVDAVAASSGKSTVTG